MTGGSAHCDVEGCLVVGSINCLAILVIDRALDAEGVVTLH